MAAGWAVPGHGWSVAVVRAPTVGAGGGGGAVGMQAQGPAPAVDDDQVVEGAQRHQVAQRGRATLRPWDQVVDLAHARRLVAAGEGAVRVAGGGGAAQVRRDDRPGLAASSGSGTSSGRLGTAPRPVSCDWRSHDASPPGPDSTSAAIASSDPRSRAIVSADSGVRAGQVQPPHRHPHDPACPAAGTALQGRRLPAGGAAGGRGGPGTPRSAGPARPDPRARSPPARRSHRSRPHRRRGRAASRARAPPRARQAASASDAPGRLRSWARVMCTSAWVGCPARPGTILAAISRRHASSSAS